MSVTFSLAHLFLICNLSQAPSCADKEEHAASCAQWAEIGECWRNADFMLQNCASSCGMCSSDQGLSRAPDGRTSTTCTNPELMQGSTYDDCFDDHESCMDWAMSDECSRNPGYMESNCRSSCYVCQSDGCHDDDLECAQWAAAGECSTNERYMVEHCSYSCRVCE